MVLCCDPNQLYLKDGSPPQSCKKIVFGLTIDSARDLHRGRVLGVYWACQVNMRHPAVAEQAFRVHNSTTMSSDLEKNSP